MPADLREKTARYERLLAEALDAATVAPPADAPLAAAAEDCVAMAESYLDDGRHFRDAGDPVNALAAFAYGHAFLDAGTRIGLLDDTDADPDLFAA
jgi:hypothetical protein